MKVLAVVPDGNVMDRVKWVAKFNPEIEWQVIGVHPNCTWEPVEWVETFVGLDCEYRETCSYPQDDDGLGGQKCLAYESACRELRSPLLGYWFHYDKHEILFGVAKLATELDDVECDMVVTWGERGWYNEVVGEWAKRRGLPWCRLERATFPGMLVADGTGLEQGKCDLEQWHHRIVDQSLLSAMDRRSTMEQWLSVAPWQAIEAQPRTTLGMASKFLDNRPSVFVPLQVPVDTNMIFRTGEVSDNHSLLEYVADKYTGYNVLVKKHPSDGFTSDSALETYCNQKGFQLVNGATHAYLQVTNEVVSINSQVIIEAWMHGLKPEILGKPAFDLPDETDKQALLYTLRFGYYIEPWQLTERLQMIGSANNA